MNKPTAHLHLVSEQTIPNLLAILALKPERVLLLRSANPRFAAAPAHLRQAAAMAGVPAAAFVDDPDLIVPEELPGIATTQRQLDKLAGRYDIRLVNITCGTKLMSIAAREFAGANGVPSLYVEKKWCSGETAELPSLPPLREVAARLTVAQVLTAYGLEPNALVSSEPTNEELAYGSQTLALMQQSPDSLRNYLRQVGERLSPGGRDPRKSEVDRILAAGLPGPDDDVQHAYLEAARAAGVVRDDGTGRWSCALCGSLSRPEDRVRAVLRCQQDLLGTWYEYACAAAMRASSRFTDVHVGVQSRRQADSAGETDVVAVEPAALSLAFVSCKVSDQYLKPLEHVFATRQRSVGLGGSFSRTLFCVHSFGNRDKHGTMGDACSVLRCGLYVGKPSFELEPVNP